MQQGAVREMETQINTSLELQPQLPPMYWDNLENREPFVDEMMDELKDDEQWPELFPNPFHADPETTDPGGKLLMKFINNLKYEPLPQHQLLDPVTKLWTLMTSTNSAFGRGEVIIEKKRQVVRSPRVYGRSRAVGFR